MITKPRTDRMFHQPPYVTRKVMYVIRSYECGHCSSADRAYAQIANEMWIAAEGKGRVPQAPRGSGAEFDAWLEQHNRTVHRLARWLAWVDSKQQKGLDG